MEAGTIVSVHPDRGYGFIYHRRNTPDVFFHAGDLVGLEFNEQLKERRVQFDVKETPKGLRAINIQAAS